ncbi:MAG: hypothetical protein DHS20C02_07830 [Micavibrio sp.]|nr:MAG: hypothetical protein DHS20C02_07830 [Micavibrio sp.]
MKRVAIIGGGLAGAACAYVLKQAGAEPVIYEAGEELAAGASGNPIGLYNPRLSAHRTPESDFYCAAFSQALRTFQELEDIEWNACGALHLITDEKRQKQLAQTIETWSWPDEEMRLLNAAQASDIAGVDLQHDALYLPQSGYVSPKKLCERYAQGIEVRLNAKIESVSDVDADAVILACGMGVKKFEEARDLPLFPVRGQVTFAKPSEESQKLRCALCYSGYILPEKEGVHKIGSTFQQGVEHSKIHDEDDRENIEALAQIAPGVAKELEVSGRWASVRVTSKDHFPVIGRAHDCKDVYVSTAHSAHGAVGSIAAAHLIADMILGRPLSLGKDVVRKLKPARFMGPV